MSEEREASAASAEILAMIQKLIAQNTVLHDAMEKIVEDEDAIDSEYERLSSMAKRARLALAQAGAIEKYDGPMPTHAAPQASDVQPVGAVADERAAFEAWAKTEGFSTARRSQHSDEYESGDTDPAWMAWKARAAAPALQGESGATLSATIETAAEMAENFFLRFDNPEHLAASIRALAPQPTQSGATVSDQRDAARLDWLQENWGLFTDYTTRDVVAETPLREAIDAAMVQHPAATQEVAGEKL